MKKNFKILLCFFFFYFQFLFKCVPEASHLYINFTKIVYNEKEQVFIRETDYSDEYKLNMIKILEYFEYPYLLKDDTLFISIELDSDIQYLWNLCNKAEDSSWLEKRKSLISDDYK